VSVSAVKPATPGIVPGVLLTVAIAIPAVLLGIWLALVGSAVFGILLGALGRAAREPPEATLPGIRFCSRTILQASIVLLGATLDLRHVASVALDTLPLMLSTIAICLIAGRLLGPVLGVEGGVRTLVSIGTAICGASAIAAVSSVIEVSAAEVAYSISTIFLFNVIAVFTFPSLGHLMQMSQHVFGVWAGTAINDTSSVVAAAYTYGKQAGDDAVITKLARASLILPIVGYFAFARARSAAVSGKPVPWRSIVPWFILWFAAASAVASTGLVPNSLHEPITKAAIIMITIALTAIGLSTNFAQIKRTGSGPLALGALLWLIVALSSLAVQHIMGIQ
jgi:uncharacterized integral membrane protein (TIGR00698 family)